MRTLLIVNPNATSTTPATRDLLAHALESRTQLTVAHTQHRGHAAELAQWAGTQEMDLIVVHGGDGTVNETVNGFLPLPQVGDDQIWKPRLGIIPGGSANVFARSLGIAADPVLATNQLLDLLDPARPPEKDRRIGLGITEDRWFTFSAGIGLDAEVCGAIDTARAKGHPATPGRYVRTTIREFFRARRKPPSVTVRIPGHDPVTGVYYAFVTNSDPWTYLGTTPVHTNPGTSFDSGLGVFAMRTMGVLATVRTVREILRPDADPHSDNIFRVDDTTSVRIESEAEAALQIDGDFIGRRNVVDFTIAPKVLDVVAPPPVSPGHI